MPPIAVGRLENQNEPKRPPLWGRLGFQLDSLEKHLITLTGLTFTLFASSFVHIANLKFLFQVSC